MTALSKEKECDALTDWIRSITNHLYWVAASTPDGDGDLMWEKWQSVGNHIQNVHSGHGSLFPTCTHAELDSSTRKKKWLKPGINCVLCMFGNKQKPHLKFNQRVYNFLFLLGPGLMLGNWQRSNDEIQLPLHFICCII